MTNETQQAFVNLDAELTGKSLRDCLNAARHQSSQDVCDLMSNLYYLSDSGYSRVRVAEDFTVHLAQGARAEVEFNWLYAEREIAAVNQALTSEVLSRERRNDS